jgi:hypothetical protein
MTMNAPNTQTQPPALDFDDIQGLILRGYNMPCARHIMLKIVDPDGARAFLGRLTPGRGGEPSMPVTTAATWPENKKPAYCLNVGVTSAGLRRLVSAEAYQELDIETSDTLFEPFNAGAVGRAKVNGDVSESAPERWWGNDPAAAQKQVSDDDLHILLSLYAHDAKERDAFTERLLGLIPRGEGGPAAIAVYTHDSDKLRDPNGKPNERIHFGYKDGISQPRIEGIAERRPGHDDRPIVPAYYFVIVDHPDAPYTAAPLFRNGSFSAFRILEQDVGAFETFLTEAAGPDGDRELVAAKMCGRWRNGTPLVTHPTAPTHDEGVYSQNNFNFLSPTPHQRGDRTPDALGARCPFSSHIRRANPRDDVQVTFNLDMARIRRIVRRGMPYGPDYTQAPDAKRGLIGHFICSSLADQFEFIQGQWLLQGSFRMPDQSPNQSGTDPLFGTHQGETIPQYLGFSYLKEDGTYTDTPMKARFVITRGALYCWLPSVTALRKLASGG